VAERSSPPSADVMLLLQRELHLVPAGENALHALDELTDLGYRRGG
jgi:hypothetical protein